MSKNIRTQLGKVVGKTLNDYHQRVKPKIDELKFKEQYQGRIIDCMVGEVDDNYIETPETDSPIVKLEHSKEGLVKVPNIKGKTILVDEDGNETDAPGEGCRLVSVGEDEDNKLIILSKNKNLFDGKYSSLHIEGGTNLFKIGVTNTRGFVIKIPKNQTIILTTFNAHNRATVGFSVDYPVENEVLQNVRTFGSNGTHNHINTNHYNYMIVYVSNENIEPKCYVGLTPNEYIEPNHHKTEILLDEPLRSLPNGVCDEIVGNKLIRRIGKVVLDGSENWWKNWRSSDDKYSSICRNDFGQKNNTVVLSNILPNISYADAYYSRHEGIGSYNNNGREYSFTLCFNKKDGYKNASDLLTVNPTTVIYELAEPIIEELPNGITLQGFDDTTMYIENSITPTVQYGYNALIPYKEELLNQKEEVETNTLDIENNIIPYLMDMEYNLMLMEEDI